MTALAEEIPPEELRSVVTQAILDADRAYRHGAAGSPWALVVDELRRHYVITYRSRRHPRGRRRA